MPSFHPSAFESMMKHEGDVAKIFHGQMRRGSRDGRAIFPARRVARKALPRPWHQTACG